jgi:hypothetical protein
MDVYPLEFVQPDGIWRPLAITWVHVAVAWNHAIPTLTNFPQRAGHTKGWPNLDYPWNGAAARNGFITNRKSLRPRCYHRLGDQLVYDHCHGGQNVARNGKLWNTTPSIVAFTKR